MEHIFIKSKNATHWFNFFPSCLCSIRQCKKWLVHLLQTQYRSQCNSSSPILCQGGLIIIAFCSDVLHTCMFGCFLQRCHSFLTVNVASYRDSKIIFDDNSTTGSVGEHQLSFCLVGFPYRLSFRSACSDLQRTRPCQNPNISLIF